VRSWLAVGVLTLTTLYGCASTKVASQVNPALGAKQFNRVLICFGVQDLALRQEGETQFVIAAARARAQFVQGHRVIFPGMTPEEIRAAVNKAQVDAVLFITQTNQGTTGTFIPPTTQTTGSAWVSGNYVRGTATTTTAGGYTIESPWASYSSQLMDLSNDRMVWVSTAQTEGSAFSSWGGLAKSMAGKTVKKLRADGLIK
jgi:hypothetical protein